MANICAVEWTMANYIDDISGVKWSTMENQKRCAAPVRIYQNAMGMETVKMRIHHHRYRACTLYAFSMVIMNFVRQPFNFSVFVAAVFGRRSKNYR